MYEGRRMLIRVFKASWEKLNLDALQNVLTTALHLTKQHDL
jgi:hypothetical protein